MMFNIAHFPTVVIVVGYLYYWIDLYFIHGNGKVSILPSFLLGLIFICFFASKLKAICSSVHKSILDFLNFSFVDKLFILIGSCLTSAILIVALHAALLPPHLPQETDALNYHITIPRQHLLINSFRHIPWSAADLFLMPVDFALAPFWFSTSLPNKIPQFIFFLCFLIVCSNLAVLFSGKNNLLIKLTVVFSIVGTHMVAIQLGTAMLDLVLCYLFFSSIESFLKGRYMFFCVEFCFFLWSKPFIPFQLGFIIVVLFILYLLLSRLNNFTIAWTDKLLIQPEIAKIYLYKLRKTAVSFFIISMLVAAPFLVKSFIVAKTPFFPFFMPDIKNLNSNVSQVIDNNDQKDRVWTFLHERSTSTEQIYGGELKLKRKDSLSAIQNSADNLLKAKDAYGNGRSLMAFVKHFWLIAVPTNGVNNEFDYPIGLPYLLALGPFFYVSLKAYRKKQFIILFNFIAVYWLSWWIGSQQSRFLFIPVIMILIIVFSNKTFYNRILYFGILFSLSLTALSMFRAHRGDFNKNIQQVLRQKDQNLIELSKDCYEKGFIITDYHDVAFANCPVVVVSDKSIFVIKQ